jgi:predicted  nucleic acid-binding Zn-ribbon protein
VTDTLGHLLAVQDFDTSITQLQHRRATLAETSGLAAVEAELAALESRRADAAGRRAELAETQKGLEQQIAAISERRDLVEKRLYATTSSSGRDLQAMQDEVRHLTDRRAELEELELVSMLDQDPVDAELSELRAAMAPVEAKAEELRGQVAHDQAEIDAALESAAGSRAAEAAQLPTALADRYETLRARLKGTGAARLIKNHCDGCHLELSSVEVERIRALPPGEVATCEQCGRMLVPS